MFRLNAMDKLKKRLDCLKFPQDNDMCITAQSAKAPSDGEYFLITYSEISQTSHISHSCPLINILFIILNSQLDLSQDLGS